jgi:hypothetical protein
MPGAALEEFADGHRYADFVATKVRGMDDLSHPSQQCGITAAIDKDIQRQPWVTVRLAVSAGREAALLPMRMSVVR